ncbi:MAG TPA: MFS transporter [Mesorhizobium sp.]|uniref:MFS transporter n=1 Tax=Mesorhizobium sp. TaxID=1871066 RepID=UPI002DDD8688|nr:MFS transporter [Mesorhizobium sp.]HEV2507017.1 MFS transporter [Mesorhizobium sp.]
MDLHIKTGTGDQAVVAHSKPISLALAIACLVVVAISLRPGIVSIGSLIPALQQEFGLSHAIVSLLVAIPDFLMGALALPSPWLARQYGRDRVILLALCLLLLSTAGRAFATNTTFLMLTTSGIGAGIAVSGALIAGFVKGNFPIRAGFVFAIYATWIGGGSTMSAALTGPIAAWTGSWRIAAGIWSLVAAFAVVAWLILMGRTKGQTENLAVGQRRGIPFGVPTAWLIAIYFACNNFLFYALLSSLVSIYTERGVSLTDASFVLAALTGGAMAGSISFGMLSRSADRRAYLVLCAVLVLTGLILIGWVPSVWPPISSAIVALGIGGGFTLATILPLDYADDADEAAAWTALVLTFGYLVAATGPILVGTLRDTFGDFSSAMWLLVAVALLKTAIAPLLGPRAQRDISTQP